MKALNWISVFLIFVNCVAQAQAPAITTTPKKEKLIELGKNSLRVEFLGRGFLYGLSYDRMISDEVAIGGAFSFLRYTFSPGVAKTSLQVISLPIYTNYYFTTGRHRFLATGGINLLSIEAKADVSDAAKRSLESDNSAFLPDLDIGTSGIVPIPQLGVGYEFRGKSGLITGANLYAMYLLGNVLPFAGVNLGVAF